MTTMPAGKFKDQCLKVLDQVASTRSPVIITKRGRPVASVVPYTPQRPGRAPLSGSILREEGDPYGTGEVWGADAD